MKLDAILDDYRRNGVTKVSGLFDDEAVAILRGEVASVLPDSDRTTDHIGFLGRSEALDRVIEDLLYGPVIQGFLTSALGPGYRLFTAAIRRTRPGAPRILMHQDRPGETKISVLLSDATSKEGTTVFCPGSHKWPFVMNSFPLPPQWLDRSTVGCTGSVGDVYFFPGRLWHGRVRSDQTTNVVALLSFLPSWVPYKSRPLPPEQYERLSPRLIAMLDGETARDDEAPPMDNALQDMLTYRTRLSPLSRWHAVRAAAAVLDAPVKIIRRIKGHPPLPAEEREHLRELKRRSMRDA